MRCSYRSSPTTWCFHKVTEWFRLEKILHLEAGPKIGPKLSANTSRLKEFINKETKGGEIQRKGDWHQRGATQISERSEKRWRYPELQHPGLGTVLNTASYSSFMEVVMKED